MKKIIFLVITFIFLFSSCSNEVIETKKYFEITEVGTGTVLDSSYQIGYTESFDSIMLGAKVGGKITSINKNVGDRVNAGELIATLDGAEARVGFSSSLDIISSLENLKNSTSKSFDLQIEATKE